MQIDKMDKVERPVLERRKMALELRSGARGGQRVIALEGVDFAFGEDPVLLDVELVITRGERVGVVGPNGAGKTVLARVLAGELEPRNGTRWVGPSIEVGYLSQAAGDMPGELPVIDALRGGPLDDRGGRGAAADALPVRLRADPAAGLDAQRRRAHAARVPRADGGRPNCLVLDEPTNHLDIDSIEVLEDALERFDGTVIAVSHDRYFLDRIADRIVLVADGEVRSFEGGWSANAGVLVDRLALGRRVLAQRALLEVQREGLHRRVMVGAAVAADRVARDQDVGEDDAQRPCRPCPGTTISTVL